MWYLQNVPGITLFLKNTKQYNILSYISFKIVPLCESTLASDCKSVGNIPGSHFVEDFSAPPLHS